MERWIFVAALCASSACTYYDGNAHWERGEDCPDDDGWSWFDAGPGDSPDGALRGVDGGAQDAAVAASCVEDAECAELEVCVEGRCAGLDDVCRIRADCGPGRACVDNACRPTCTDDTSCGHGTSCMDGSCRPTAECAIGRDCAAGQACIEARCLDGCADDAECGADATCDGSGVCRPDVRPRPFCVEDSECATGHLCVDGVCRSPCPSATDEECQRWDTQLVLCGQPEPGLHLCYTRAEANPECVTRAECSAAEHCIDGLCR